MSQAIHIGLLSKFLICTSAVQYFPTYCIQSTLPMQNAVYAQHATALKSLKLILETSTIISLLTFCVSRRRRKMYCGYARLCVYVSVCPRPHAYSIARTRM